MLSSTVEGGGEAEDTEAATCNDRMETRVGSGCRGHARGAHRRLGIMESGTARNRATSTVSYPELDWCHDAAGE